MNESQIFKLINFVKVVENMILQNEEVEDEFRNLTDLSKRGIQAG